MPHRILALAALYALLPTQARAQAAPPDPGVRIQLSAWVSPRDVDTLTFSQHGKTKAGWLEYDERSLQITFHATDPIDTTQVLSWDAPASVEDAMSPYGPVYSSDFNQADECDFSIDVDEDGLSDCAEQPDQLYWGQPIHAWGATVGPKDLFVKIGHQRNDDDGNGNEVDRPWTRPFPKALAMVRDAYANYGYAVHFDVGNLYQGQDFDGYQPEFEGAFDLSGADNGFDFDSIGWISPSNECADIYSCQGTTYLAGWPSPHANYFGESNQNFIEDYRRSLIDPDDRVFYFVMFSHVSNGSSGIAHNAGANAAISVASNSDAVLTLDPNPQGANYWRPRTAEEVYNKTVNYQAGTLMHEMGHMMGLLEGGHDRIEGKPNYFSSMSYVYQLVGLPQTYEGFVKRFENFNENAEWGPCDPVWGSQIPNGPLGSPDNFVVDYSNDETSLLDESQLDETVGFFYGPSMDWNCDGVLDNAIAHDISGNTLIDGPPNECMVPDPVPDHADQQLISNRDWGAIQLYHRTHFGQAIPNDGLAWSCPLP